MSATLWSMVNIWFLRDGSTRVDEEKVLADALPAIQRVIKKAGITELVQAWKHPHHHYLRKADINRPYTHPSRRFT